MRTILLIWVYFTFLMLSTPAVSQGNLDSLKQLLSRNTHDTIEVNVLNILSESLYHSETDSSRILAKKAERLSNKLNYKKGLAYAFHNLGTSFFVRSEFDSALMYFERALAMKIEMQDSASISGTLNNIAAIFFYNGNYAVSLHHFQQALKLKIDQGDSLKVASTLHNIGFIYAKQKNYDLSLHYYNRALEIRKSHGDINGQASTLTKMGLLYLDRKDYSKALAYETRAFEILDSLNIKCRSVHPATNIGLSYKALNELDLALEYLNLGYEYAVVCKDSYTTSRTLLGIGEILAKQGLKKQAEDKMLESYQIAENQSFKDRMQEASNRLYDFYRFNGNVSKALQYLEITTRLKDELFNEELTEQLTTMELNYTFELERDSLEYQKQAELLNINSRLEQQRLFKRITILGLLIALIFVMVIYRNYRLKQSANLNLRKKNEIQEEKLTIEEATRKQLEIENNKKARSLTATSIQLLNFNEKLTEIIDEIRHSADLPDDHRKKVIKNLECLRNDDDHWNSIKIHFENVHPNFFQKLEQHFPNLSANDHKLLAFLKMKLSNKEIATILNVTRRAVEQSKTRVKKKLGMDKEDKNILEYVNQHAQT
ncbi:tetratricopeptide repeat protein [Fulvivirga sp. M361]|uniref:tetratricopeptide repeat protein n=1 Tax=Fulvivirga sp. M361 TaxID=2594266 RepID=UPI00117BB379|nr:tetratricopeptide repeat protein [Fulvivirga sp. M361]TRX59177.1 tetratricopeptide repeat protein [Fulvivirga sp. M361]